MTIIELCTEEELREAYPVMHELRTHLDEQQYLDLLKVMIGRGYRLFALREDGEIVALAGIEIGTNLYYGRHVWVYDLVTKAEARSKGYGRVLLEYVEDFARREGCACVALSSAFWRTGAHRFYEQHMGYERVSYVFKKVIE